MKKILIVLLILIVVLIVLSSLMKRNQISNAMLIITDTQEKVHPVTRFDSDDMVKVTTSKGDFSAVNVANLLNRYNVNEQWKEMTFYSSDGAQVTILAEENAELYLAEITKDEKTYLRLVIPTDPFPQRWLKYINQIKLK